MPPAISWKGAGWGGISGGQHAVSIRSCTSNHAIVILRKFNALEKPVKAYNVADGSPCMMLLTKVYQRTWSLIGKLCQLSMRHTVHKTPRRDQSGRSYAQFVAFSIAPCSQHCRHIEIALQRHEKCENSNVGSCLLYAAYTGPNPKHRK